jgi:hypothetical protein
VTGPLPALGAPVQIAYAVPDAVAAAEDWSRRFGAGPFLVRPHVELVDVMYRGAPGEFHHTSAYGHWGSVMVELVQDHGAGPSPIREMFAVGETGVHHLAFIVDSLDESLKALVAAGYSIALSARTTGGVAFHFVDAVATHGHMLELYERSPRVLAFYEEIAAPSRGWDGRDPVRFG